MNVLNIGWWTSSKLHVFKINGLSPNDMVISAKMKIMEMGHINDVEKLELIYCGSIMENLKKLSHYVKRTNPFVFMVKKEETVSDKVGTFSPNDLQKLFDKYEDILSKANTKRTLLNAMKPDIITELVDMIPELSADLIALSIIKDNKLFESVLEPSVLKPLLTKHPAIMITVDYLMQEVIKNINGRLRSPTHLMDDDFSEYDGLDIYYNLPNVSTIDDNFIERSFLFRNNTRNPSTENSVANRITGPSNIFERIQMESGNLSDELDLELEMEWPGLSRQLLKMHELGLLDDTLNFRALQISGGNVQHAVELILNKIIE